MTLGQSLPSMHLACPSINPGEQLSSPRPLPDLGAQGGELGGGLSAQVKPSLKLPLLFLVLIFPAEPQKGGAGLSATAASSVGGGNSGGGEQS